MTKITTYNLKNECNSNRYYKEISVFTDSVLKRIKAEFVLFIKEYEFYHNIELKNNYREISLELLELLTLAINYKLYNKKLRGVM